jgi:hypothetical protein
VPETIHEWEIMKITQDTEIILDGKKYLLEAGDEITLNEGIISAILRKLLPIPFEALDAHFQRALYKAVKDPTRVQKLKTMPKEFWDQVGSIFGK